MNNIAIIPARSGSKGLKDKNIKLFCGRPLLSYTIDAAIKSGIYAEVMVSTDSEEYANIATEYGAKVPFLRSEEMSSDKASTWDTVREVLLKYKEHGQVFETMTLLQPTSPLRTSDDIIKAFGLFNEKNADTVIGVCEAEHSPLWMNVLPENGSLEGFLRNDIFQAGGRQNLSAYYRINGALYIHRLDYDDLAFNLYERGSFAYIMPRERSVDIDTAMDFAIAEFMYKNVDGLCSNNV